MLHRKKINKQYLSITVLVMSAQSWATPMCKIEPYIEIEKAFMLIEQTAKMQKELADEAAKKFDKGYKFNRNINWAARGFGGIGLLAGVLASGGMAAMGATAGTAKGAVAGYSSAAVMLSTTSVLTGRGNLGNEPDEPVLDAMNNEQTAKQGPQLKEFIKALGEVAFDINGKQWDVGTYSKKLREAVESRAPADKEHVDQAAADILLGIGEVNKSYMKEQSLVQNFFIKHQEGKKEGGGASRRAKNWLRGPFGGDAKQYWQRHHDEQVALFDLAERKLVWAERNLLATRAACGAPSPKVIDEARPATSHGG